MPLTIADVSEFQGVVHPTPGTVLIARAHNGWRPDNSWVGNRAAAHAAPVAALGIYQSRGPTRTATTTPPYKPRTPPAPAARCSP